MASFSSGPSLVSSTLAGSYRRFLRVVLYKKVGQSYVLVFYVSVLSSCSCFRFFRCIFHIFHRMLLIQLFIPSRNDFNKQIKKYYFILFSIFFFTHISYPYVVIIFRIFLVIFKLHWLCRLFLINSSGLYPLNTEMTR